MAKYSSVLKTERLKRTYLCFFLCRKAVHCGYHCKHGYKQEKHGQYRTHGFALVRLASC